MTISRDKKNIAKKWAAEVLKNKRELDSWKIYKNLYRLPPKKPYSERIFQVDAFIHWIKIGYLIQNRKAKRMHFAGRARWSYDLKKYNGVPPRLVFKELKRIFKGYEAQESEEDEEKESRFLRHLSIYVHRTKSPGFLKLKDELFDVTRWKRQPRPATISCVPWNEALRRVKAVEDFILQEPGEKVWRRKILRNLRIHEEDLNDIKILLIGRSIYSKGKKPKRRTGKKPKCILYYRTQPKSLTGLLTSLNGKT
jgi:hypothetical protein